MMSPVQTCGFHHGGWRGWHANLSLEEKIDLLVGTAVKDQSLEEKLFVTKNGHETTLKFNMEPENQGFILKTFLFQD